jgi:KDO2-lipid IV(A) lauroyltransferase
MLLYILIAPFLYLVSYLPSSVLYKIADVLAFLLRDVVQYRKKVVLENIRLCFPEKTETEQLSIFRESYIHLADRIVETVKCISISKQEVHQRVKVRNIDLMNHWYKEKKNVVVLLGHIGSWELGAYKASLVLQHKTYGVVSLLSNRYFNAMIQRTRGRMGMHLVGMQDMGGFLKKAPKELTTVIFISDQSPNSVKAYWTDFLNRDTGFFTGGERYAKVHNCAVIYIEIKQIERGKYEIELFKICDDASTLPKHEIMEQFSKHLESTLKNNPSDWLWSHNRWKRKRS